jgi:LmbE family N-acetylglucosaminyl deacetylase
MVPDLKSTYNSASKADHLRADLDYLTDTSLIRTADPELNRIARSNSLVNREEGHIDHLRRHPASLRAIKWSNAPESWEYEEAMAVQFEQQWPAHRKAVEHHVARALASELRSRGEIALSVFDSTGSLPLCPEVRKQQIIKVVMRQARFPAASTPLQDIVAFREEVSNRRSLRAMRRWIRGLAEQNITEGEIREEVQYLYDECERSIRRGRLRGSVSVLEACFVTTAEVAESLIKLKLKKLAELGVHIFRAADDLLDSETPVRGEEIAYLAGVRRQLDKSQ